MKNPAKAARNLALITVPLITLNAVCGSPRSTGFTWQNTPACHAAYDQIQYNTALIEQVQKKIQNHDYFAGQDHTYLYIAANAVNMDEQEAEYLKNHCQQ